MKSKFIINTITGWDEPPRARHQVAYALAEKHEVVFIARNSTALPGIEIQHIDDRLTVIKPSFPLDFRLRIRIPIVNELYQRWLFRKMKRAYPDHLVINFDFTGHRIFSYFNKVVYYCNDECIGNTKYPNWFTDLYYRLCEKSIVKRSLMSIGTTPYLVNKLSQYNPRTYQIPLGANMVSDKLVYGKSGEGKRIRVCYMGDIKEHLVSVDLLNEIISSDLFHLVLIGPVEDSFISRLESIDEVTFTGVLKGADLINALSGIDVGLALYNEKNINPGASPNKLWQYLSVGKPAIVSFIENLWIPEAPSRSVYVYHKSDSLRDMIVLAFTEHSEALFRERIEFIKSNTWEKRMEAFLELLEQNK